MAEDRLFEPDVLVKAVYDCQLLYASLCAMELNVKELLVNSNIIASCQVNNFPKLPNNKINVEKTVMLTMQSFTEKPLSRSP